MATPLPWKKTIPVCILLFCEALNANSLFAYVGNMVKDLMHEDNRENVGYYAGLIASCWFLAQFLSSFFWGRMSDKVGRRPILIAGVFGSFASSIAFGFSFNLPFAIFSRSLNGILNGNIGVIKTYMAEFTDSSNQARAFGLIGLMWGFGNIAGSMVGGFASSPASKYPSIFSSTGLFAKFPYLLPNLIAAAFSLCGFIATIIYLQENEINYTIVKEEIEMDADMEVEISSEQKLGESNRDVGKEEPLLSATEREEAIASFEAVPIEETKPSTKSNFFTKKLKSLNENNKNFKNRPQRSQGTISVLKDRNVLMTCFMYAILGGYCTMWDEVVPIWSFAEVKYGGLGFNTDNIGVLNAISGTSVILVQLFLYHRVVARLKCVKTFRLGSFLMLPIICVFPAVTYLNAVGSWAVWGSMSILLMLRCFAAQCCFSAVMQLITNSADFSDMGAVNGLGQSLVALFRAVAPAVGSSLLAWSFGNGYPFPLNHFFVYLLSAVIGVIPLVMSFKLPFSLNLPKNELTTLDQDKPSLPHLDFA